MFYLKLHCKCNFVKKLFVMSTNVQISSSALYNNNCINLIYSSWKENISFIASYLNYCTSHKKRKSIYIFINLLAISSQITLIVSILLMKMYGDLCSSHQHPFKMWEALVLQNAHLNEEVKGRGRSFDCAVRKLSCKLVLLTLTVQAGGEQGL